MDIQRIYDLVYPYFRGRRLNRLTGAFRPGPQTTILDVGGCPTFWQYGDISAAITVLNLPSYVPPSDLRGCKMVRGDGTRLEFEDDSFDIAHSNSVIEHLGTWEQQMAFGREIRRVGRGVWVQTPAKCFPFECHTLDPFFYWLPNRCRRLLLRHFSLWGWIKRPSLREIDEFLTSTRLLNYREMQALFPDCTILRERFCGWTKSYIAFRPSSTASCPKSSSHLASVQ